MHIRKALLDNPEESSFDFGRQSLGYERDVQLDVADQDDALSRHFQRIPGKQPQSTETARNRGWAGAFQWLDGLRQSHAPVV